MRLPQLPYEIKKYKKEINSVKGLNYTDNFDDGSLAATLNMSTRRYPYLTTRRTREKYQSDNYTGAQAIFSWEKLLVISNDNKLYYDDQYIGALVPQTKERQFAVVNTHLVIFPDKVYIDVNLPTSVHPLQESLQFASTAFTETSIQFTAPYTTGTLKAGDAVFISGCVTEPGNNLEGAAIIKEVKEDEIVFVGEEVFTPCTEAGTITIERRIPDFDYICESNNRLWGCSNADKTIMASALGDPTVFYDYSGESTDSYALAIGSEGEFTGCITLGSSILFWKNNTLHKILGAYPAEYSMYTYKIEGVSKGSNKSMQIINETLFYLSDHGVYSYAGGNTSLLSYVLGDQKFKNGAAGTDGENYYISCFDKDNNPILLVYDVRHKLWIMEDNTDAIDFARVDTVLYMLDSEGEIYKLDREEAGKDLEWMVQYKPFFETIEGRKTFSKLLIRCEAPKTSYGVISVRHDDGYWKEIGRIVGKENDVCLAVVPIARSDKFEVKIEGRGQFTILGILREYKLRSDV